MIDKRIEAVTKAVQDSLRTVRVSSVNEFTISCVLFGTPEDLAKAVIAAYEATAPKPMNKSDTVLLIAKAMKRGFWSADRPHEKALLTQAEKAYRAPLAAGAISKQEWLPIESAPKDGTYILCAHASGHINILQFSGNASDLSCPAWRKDCYTGQTWKPTHWMPLPKPPTIKKEGV